MDKINHTNASKGGMYIPGQENWPHGVAPLKPHTHSPRPIIGLNPSHILPSILDTIVSLQHTIKTLEETVKAITGAGPCEQDNNKPKADDATITDAIYQIIEEADNWISHPRDVNLAIKTFLASYRAIEAAGHSMESIMEWLKKEVGKGE